MKTVTIPREAGRRTRLEADDRREQIVAAARTLFAQRPYDSVSTGDIAARAGTTRTNIHYHFNTKRDLFLAVVEQFSRIPATITPDGQDLPAITVVDRVLGRWLDAVERNSDVFLTMLHASSSQDPEVSGVLGTSMRAWETRITTLVGIDASNPAHRAMARSFQGMVTAATSEWLVHDQLDKASVHALLTHTLVAVGDAAREIS